MCEVTTEISVFGHDVKPVHCPMCGHDIDEEDLIEKNNCYFWTLEKLITQGGAVKWYKSAIWFGYHCTWVSPDGVEWEYTLPKMKRTSLWKVMWYHGTVRPFTSRNNHFL